MSSVIQKTYHSVKVCWLKKEPLETNIVNAVFGTKIPLTQIRSHKGRGNLPPDSDEGRGGVFSCPFVSLRLMIVYLEKRKISL